MFNYDFKYLNNFFLLCKLKFEILAPEPKISTSSYNLKNLTRRHFLILLFVGGSTAGQKKIFCFVLQLTKKKVKKYIFCKTRKIDKISIFKFFFDLF